MPKRAKPNSTFVATVLLAATALALFLGGEGLIMTRTDGGRLAAARWLHVGDDARLHELIARQVRRGLDDAGVPRDSVRESVRGTVEPRVHWRIGLKPHASTLQVNYAITRALESQGAAVLSGREAPGEHGELLVTLVAGLPGRPTHELLLVRPGSSAEPKAEAQSAGRLALVLYGLGDDLAHVTATLSRPQPFAAAIPAGQSWSEAAFRAARSRQREVVLHLPLEPLNYPRMDPGPGTILVTMGSARIEGLVRKYLDQAGPVAAVANLSGSLATQDQSVMSAVYRVLRERRTPFLHVTPAAGAVCRPLASQLGVAYARPDLMIEAGPHGDTKQLDAGWKQALELARRRGRAVVMLRAGDAALAWLPGALAPGRLGGVEIVPLTALLRKPPAM
jgi:polysaccharide deacetylase 2 family uncharacterized protein YibQ